MDIGLRKVIKVNNIFVWFISSFLVFVLFLKILNHLRKKGDSDE